MEDHGIPPEYEKEYLTVTSQDMWQVKILNADMSPNCIPAIFELETPFLGDEFWFFHADEPRSALWLTGMAVLKLCTWLVFNAIMVASAILGIIFLIGVFASLQVPSSDTSTTFIYFLIASCPFLLTMVVLAITDGCKHWVPHAFSKTKVRTKLK